MAESVSYFTKTVTLFDWWLVKTQTHVAVSGTTSMPKQAQRVFSSAPIAKRYDLFTLETTDGICVLLKSLINTHKSIQNGFPSQVVKKFALGFPNDWEQYALQPGLETLESGGTIESPSSVGVTTQPESKLERKCPIPEPVEARHCENPGNKHTPDTKRGRNSQNHTPKEQRTIGRKSKRKTEVALQKNDATTPGSKTKKKINFEEQATPLSQRQKAGKRVISPECLSIGRSRFGRILLPVLEFWRNQIPVYDMNRTVTGILEDRSVLVPARESAIKDVQLEYILTTHENENDRVSQ